jgi:hypothetical protein
MGEIIYFDPNGEKQDRRAETRSPVTATQESRVINKYGRDIADITQRLKPETALA